LILSNLALKNIYNQVKANAFLKNLETLEEVEVEFQFFFKIIRSVELNYIVPEDFTHLDLMEKKMTLKLYDDKNINNNFEEEEEVEMVKKPLEEFFNMIYEFRRDTENYFTNEIFLIDSIGLKLDSNDISILKETVDLSSSHEKLVHILTNIPTIIQVLKLRKDIDNWGFNKNLVILNYKYDKTFTFIANWLTVSLSLLTNLLLLIDLNLETYHTIYFSTRMASAIQAVDGIHLIINGCLILNFIYVDGFLNIRVNKHIALVTKLPIFWNFAIIMVANTSEKLTFLYSLTLLSLVPIIEVMRIVIISLSSRYDQFLATIILLIVVIWFFAGIAFYFLRDDMYLTDRSINFCPTYIACFINQFTFGLRDLGVKDQPDIMAFGQTYYWQRFFYDWFFFLFTIFLLLNIVNGIVVDTFQEYRESNSENEHQLKNVCYICSLDRGSFEIKAIDFDYHRANEHSIRDYIDFLIKIYTEDEYNLDSTGSQTLKLLKNNEPELFPLNKAMSLEKRKLKSSK